MESGRVVGGAAGVRSAGCPNFSAVAGRGGGADNDDEQFAEGLPPAGMLREIVKVEGQRCALHTTPLTLSPPFIRFV